MKPSGPGLLFVPRFLITVSISLLVIVFSFCQWFVVRKLLSLMRSHLNIFAFVSFALGSRYIKLLLRVMSKSVLPMFSSRSFMVSGLQFSSLIHFEFIFVYSVRECSNLILLT